MKGPCPPRWIAVCASFSLLIVALRAESAEPWLAPGNVQARHDLQLLNDSGLIDLPASGWPIPVADLRNALDAAVAAGGTPSAAQSAALRRLLAVTRAGDLEFAVDVGAAARPLVLRTFADTPREEGELSVYAAGAATDRVGGRVELTAVVDPDDDRPVRLDGSYVAGQWGNWLFTLGAQDRWWGSGWDGSLILSNNARPVPAIALDRAVSHPFESKWLRWIGPWRLTTFMGRMEGDRQDYANPLLFGLRISARPLDGLEVSLERTAQWCGEGRDCGWEEFWNLFSGHDNRGENVSAEDEPGNQLAGWDIRWASPIGDGPYALYFQHTGESIDEDYLRPYRSLELAGAEIWGNAAAGSSWRTSFEWAYTRCGGTQNGRRLWDCAYDNTIFSPDGYRYYGRPVGHSMDGDGESFSARWSRVDEADATLGALVRYVRVNAGGEVPDTRHSIAQSPEDWWVTEVTYRKPLRLGWLELQAGVERRDRERTGEAAVLPRFAVMWHRQVR